MSTFNVSIFGEHKEQLDRIEAKLDTILAAIKQEKQQMAALDDQITVLTKEVADDTTVVGSAVTALNGIPALIKTAVDQALAAGATPAQLQAFTDLGNTLTANTTTLAAAVANATPAAPTIPAPAAAALAKVLKT